jgi:DNA-binding MarR family transcriptional regulator
MFGFFKKKVEKDDVDKIKLAVQTGFNSVKYDISSLTKWVDYLNKNNTVVKNDINGLKNDLANINDDIENLKNILDIVANSKMFKHRQTVFNKQSVVDDVLNSVQTSVQTVFLDNLTTNERAIIFVLMNSDLKLSYEDLASILGKKKSTIRGQINSIRKKNDELIQEIIGENNKKRVFIPEKIKEMLLKTRKVRDKNKGK